MDHPKVVQAALEQITLLPGIGKKTALRLTLHLLRQNKEYSVTSSATL